MAVLIMAIVCGLLAVFAASSSSSPCSPASAEERQSFRLIIDEFEPGTLLVPDLGKEIASATGNDVVRSKSIEIKRETTYIQQLLLPYLECVQDFVQDESPDLSQNWKSYLPVGNAFSDYMSRSTSTIEKIEKRRHALTKAVERLARMISTLKTHLPATVPLDNSQSLSDDLAAKTRYLTNALDKLGIANNGLKHSLARVGHQIQSNRAPSTGTDKHRHLDTDAMVERVHELRDLKSEVRENLVRALSSAKKRDLWLFYADEEQRRANAQQPLRPGVLVTKGRRGRTN